MQCGFFSRIGFFAIIMFTNNISDRNIEMSGECKIPLIAARHGHDGACTITCQYILRNPDRNFSSIKWIDSVGTCKASSDLFYIGLPFSVAAAFYIVQVFFYCFFLFSCCYLCNEIKFGSNYHKIYSEDGIGPGGVNYKL